MDAQTPFTLIALKLILNAWKVLMTAIGKTTTIYVMTVLLPNLPRAPKPSIGSAMASPPLVWEGLTKEKKSKGKPNKKRCFRVSLDDDDDYFCYPYGF